MVLFLLLLLTIICSAFIAYSEEHSFPAIWNVAAKNDYFVGRKDELLQIKSMLDQNNKVAIIGVGGVGKTQLAKKFVHEHHKQYEIIWWFDANKNMDDQFINLAHELNYLDSGKFKIDLSKSSAKAVVRYVLNMLRLTNKSWLIIFDNVIQVELIQDYIPETHDKKNSHIIITSRNANELLSSIQLKDLEPEEALEFLTKATQESNIEQLKKLAGLLDYFPFALAQAASNIKTNSISIEDYINLYNTDKKQLWQFERSFLKTSGDVFDLNHSDLETTLNLNLMNINKESKAAIIILAVDSLLELASISEELLLDILKSCGFSEDDFRAAIRTLKKYSLIDGQRKNNKQYYSVHDLVKAKIDQDYYFVGETETQTNRFKFWLRKVFNKNDASISREFLINQILTVLCNYLDKPWGEMVTYINQQSELINVANNFAFNIYKNGSEDSLLITLLVSLLEHNNMIFHMKSSYTLYQEQVAALFNLLEIKKIKVDPYIESKVYLNSIYVDTIYPGEHNAPFHENKMLEAEQYFASKYFGLNGYNNEDNKVKIDDCFLAYIRLGEFYLIRGYVDKTLYYMDKAYALLKDIKNINYQAQFWYVLTWLHLQKGDYLKADEYIKTFFDITKKEQIYPLHLYAKNIQGSINFYLNNYAQALNLSQECFDEANQFFQSKTSDIAAESLITQTRAYKALGDYVEAEEKAIQAIKTLDIVFGRDDIDFSQAVAHRLYGELLEEKKQYKQAYEEYKFAEDFYLKVYKDQFYQMREVAELFANLAILGIRINDLSLTKNYFQKLVENFSLQNINTQKVIEELDSNNIEISRE